MRLTEQQGSLPSAAKRSRRGLRGQKAVVRPDSMSCLDAALVMKLPLLGVAGRAHDPTSPIRTSKRPDDYPKWQSRSSLLQQSGNTEI